jgi:hypothetical protein
MLETERVNAIFADARLLYDDALEQLESGKLRNAAEKAWGATKRATDALILARTAPSLPSGKAAQRGQESCAMRRRRPGESGTPHLRPDHAGNTQPAP